MFLFAVSSPLTARPGTVASRLHPSAAIANTTAIFTMTLNEKANDIGILFQPRVTPEYESLVNFLTTHPDVDAWEDSIPFAVKNVKRAKAKNVDLLQDALQSGEGCAVIVEDALDSWPALQFWGTEYLVGVAGNLIVRVNDRAPARHADQLRDGGAQRTICVKLRDYVSYVTGLPASIEHINTKNPVTPFYLNGWRAFLECPVLEKDSPPPSFASPIDDTQDILRALDRQLFGSSGSNASSSLQMQQSDWCFRTNSNLNKVFIGPPGTITRLHYDAGDAHGWLAQVCGRKLFVLFPPSDSSNLYPLETEVETVQSPIDPLHPDTDRWPNYCHCKPQACLVQPGEAIVIPKGWWHFAVAVDQSITVQRNFYEAKSNANGLVKMVLQTIKNIKLSKGDQRV